ncbi:MAG: hypothetical protein IJF06_00945 [Bacteroidaceae bacterium]|nr:hypothetical protein [Bacteroidaceae bacterium]
MPNICITHYVIEGEKKEINALYETMTSLQAMEQPLVASDFGPTWLGCLVKALGKNPEEILCRGEWMDLERADDTLRVTFETAWTPCYEVAALIKNTYPSLHIYYKAEEPGNGIYVKNDVEGKYFPETEQDGCPYRLMTEEEEQLQVRIIKGLQTGETVVTVTRGE